MDWNLIVWIAGQGLLVVAAFWLGLTVGYRMKLRRASRLEWAERDRSHLWAGELETEGLKADRLIEFEPILEWRDGIPQFRGVRRP